MAGKRKRAPGVGSEGSYEETRFRSIFQHSAVSLWEEDISGLRAALGALGDRGVTDIGAYLDAHPEFLDEAARLITVVDVNEATLELYEVADRRQLLGPLATTLDMADPVTRASLRDDVLLIARGGTRAERESRARTPSGKRLDIVIRLSVPGPHDPYSHMLVNVLDITRRRQAEEGLRQSEQHYRELAAAAQRQTKELELLNQVRTALTREMELPDVFHTVVEGIASAFGYSHVSIYLLRGDMLECQYQFGYRSVVERIPVTRGVSGRVVKTGAPVLVTDVGADPDFIGAIDGLCSELCIPLFDRGRVAGVLNVESVGATVLGQEDLRLMTALGEHVNLAISRARLYTEARESEQRYRTLVENLGEGIAVVEPDERFRFANPAAEKIFGVAPGALVGRTLREFLSDEEWLRTRAETGKRLRGESTTYEQEIIRPDGTVRLIELIATPQYDPGGAFSSTFGVFRDITEERRTREALRKSEERLAQSQKLEAVGRLAGGVAHDFNNLLTVIRGYADLLDMRMNDAHPMKADAREIKRAADRAANLTAQLLAFSRGQVMRPRVLDLNEVVRGMRNMIGRLIGEDIELRTQLAAGPMTVKADQGQVEQVAMNLAANARDAMPRGGVLTLTTSPRAFGDEGTGEHAEIPPGDYVSLEVSDTGVGIDRDTLSRIFEPFFTTKEVGRGTGLGLATVYGIVKQSGGFIYCASEPGAGTTFTVFLPRVSGEAVEAPGARAGPSRPGKESVLVVEDEEAIANFILSILRRNGYDATGARGGAEALSIFSARPGGFALLLADIVMPQMSGLELGRRIAASDPGTRILYMTGYSAHPLVQAGAANGAIDILHKPFTAEELLQKVRETLDAAASGQDGMEAP